MASITVYPSSDGYVYKNDSTDWATTRGATAGNIATNDPSADTYPITGKDGSNFIIGRAFFMLDMSVMDTGDVATAATWSVVQNGAANGDADNDGKDYIVYVAGTPASNDTLVTGDFDQIGTTAFTSTIDIGSINSGVANDFTVTAAGLTALNTAISSGGFFVLAGREGHDMDNEAFVGSDNTFNYGAWYFTAQGGASRPALTITYTPAAGATAKNLSLLGVGQ